MMCFSYTVVDKKSVLKEQSDAEVRKRRLQGMVSALLVDCFALCCSIKKAGLDNRKEDACLAGGGCCQHFGKC